MLEQFQHWCNKTLIIPMKHVVLNIIRPSSLFRSGLEHVDYQVLNNIKNLVQLVWSQCGYCWSTTKDILSTTNTAGISFNHINSTSSDCRGHDILRQDVTQHGQMRQQKEKSIQGDDAVSPEEYTGHGRDMSGLVSQYSLLPEHHDEENEPLLDQVCNQ